MISRVLLETGCQLYTAGSAEEAMQLMKAADPNVVIADIRLPGMSGVELTDEIKRLHPDTPVLLISAYRPPEGHGADGFIGKPFDNEELVERVQSMLDPSRAEGDEPGASGIPEIRF